MRAKTFPRGIHPPEFKSLSEHLAFETLPAPDKVYIPLHQHFGAPAKSLVNKGDEVLVGQKIGEAPALFSADVHSSVSGKVLAVEPYIHPAGRPVLSVAIQNNGEDRRVDPGDIPADPTALSAEEIRKKVKEAGVVGMGGAAFPTAVKLSPPKDKPIDTVIINGCECEPVLTADHRLMLEFPEDIINGALLVRKATGAARIIIGVENNKKDALDLLRKKAAGTGIEVETVKTKYPQGAEKNLISAILKREVPKGGLPFDVGVVVQNVATAKAVWDAVARNLPLYERPLTVSGPMVTTPKNLIVRIGTPFQVVLDSCGGINGEADTLIMGGPMMGLSQWTADVPVIKGTSGILLWKMDRSPREYACIRCSRCVDHCPMGLVPTQIMKLVKYDHLEKAEAWGAQDCVECGSCQYGCPAKIPLVHWIRLGKNKIISIKKKKSA